MKDIVQRITDYEKEKEQEAKNKELANKLAAEIRSRRPRISDYRKNRQINIRKFSFTPTKQEVHGKIENQLKQNFKDYMNKV